MGAHHTIQVDHDFVDFSIETTMVTWDNIWKQLNFSLFLIGILLFCIFLRVAI
jgi:Zn-dependent membrane protease YugP